ncbi:Uncharacterized conserved protein, tellurite resistance protein B (TerB) family [Colwellia chukchiensis]|uniref:Uncharacterized conserved protein, tellurite resistance protein B (TerB) family n=1 Tax=Colwellia chukchiensis TaxID=641665 RepID=A0A1H7L8Y9_9GAMM|nr:TerB family tellurite resistance protein [Colwellia chukchiensis]SEK95324.1 Uncharacterized conserved protein, tellurite resistance protein B (TerB) family [Colwellia chukchiensis]
MLSKISTFFQSLGTAAEQSEKDISLELACSVLLCEVMLADGKQGPDEQQKLSELLQQQFHLSNQQTHEIISLALSLCENATDFYQFTKTINENYSLQQRITMVDLLWKMAYADGELASIEEHIIRKIADLLHLRHSEFIQTKLHNRAK